MTNPCSANVEGRTEFCGQMRVLSHVPAVLSNGEGEDEMGSDRGSVTAVLLC